MGEFGKSKQCFFMSQVIPYTGTLVRQHDPDRFFLTLLQPASVRPALWALLAFNYEVAKTREVVSEPTLGYMRLQWWREALEKLYAGHSAPKHEILEPLADVIRQYKIPFELFDTLLTGREFDLEDKTPETITDLKNYIDSTVAPLTRLMLVVANEPADGADHISQAYGIAGLMRAIPSHAQQGRCFIPKQLSTLDELFRDGEKRQNVLINLHNEACQELVEAGSFKSRLLRQMGDVARLYLNHMSRLKYDLLNERFSQMPPFFHLRLMLKG